MGLSQRIHSELINKIQELVCVGTTEPMEVKKILKHHVHHYMCAEQLPDPNDKSLLSNYRGYLKSY